MDVLTLPTEMVASIAKHLNYAKLVELRKMNALVDATAKRYGLGKRLPAKDCWFVLKEALIQLVLEENVSQACGSRQKGVIENKGHLYELKSAHWQGNLEILNKIKISQFNISDYELTRTTLETFQTYADAFKECWSIAFHYIQLACSKEEFINFLNIFPKALELELIESENNEYILNYEFLSSRKWKYIRVDGIDSLQCGELDDRFLDLIVTNRIGIYMYVVYPSFSLHGVVEALKTLSSGTEKIGRSMWGRLDIGDMNPEIALDLFETVEGINVNWMHGWLVEVKFERDPSMYVHFGLSSTYEDREQVDD